MQQCCTLLIQFKQRQQIHIIKHSEFRRKKNRRSLNQKNGNNQRGYVCMKMMILFKHVHDATQMVIVMLTISPFFLPLMAIILTCGGGF